MPGIAIPFYLAHPRLMRLEKAQMLEVEGGTPEWCLQILRHEAGHAFDNAYALRTRRRRVRLFGRPSTPYPDFYLPKPYSKSFVLHLDSWYAQSHPDEDFAETFAVWLTPDSDWRTRYQDWPALRKLEYMDALMAEIARQRPVDRDPPRRRAARSPADDAAQALRAEARALRRSTTRTSTTAICGASSRTRPEYAHNRKASRVIHQHPARRPPPRRRMDRDVSIHDRSRHRGHDRALATS